MEQNFDLFRWLSGNYDMSSCHRSYFASMIQSVTGGIDKTLGSISAVSPSVGGSFFRTAAYNRA